VLDWFDVLELHEARAGDGVVRLTGRIRHEMKVEVFHAPPDWG
jgi:hypothetical protein